MKERKRFKHNILLKKKTIQYKKDIVDWFIQNKLHEATGAERTAASRSEYRRRLATGRDTYKLDTVLIYCTSNTNTWLPRIPQVHAYNQTICNLIKSDLKFNVPKYVV